jgi:hypothetical protein
MVFAALLIAIVYIGLFPQRLIATAGTSISSILKSVNNEEQIQSVTITDPTVGESPVQAAKKLIKSDKQSKDIALERKMTRKPG